MEEFKIFKNESFGEIRVSGTKDEPLFCLSDVCRILDIKNVSQCKTRLKQDGVILNEGVSKTKNQYGTITEQKVTLTFINEQNLYKLIMRSSQPNAEPFQDWVCGEVLPTIRKTGGYVNSTVQFVDTYFPDLDDDAKKFMIETLENKKRLLEENKQQKKYIEENSDKVDFYDTVVLSDDTIDMRQVATTLNMGIGRNKLFDILRKEGILDRRNQPYQKYIDSGYFRTIETNYTKGDELCIYIKTVVFQKGLDYIRRVVEKHLNIK